MNRIASFLIIPLALITIIVIKADAQSFSTHSLKVSVGLGINEGSEEIGVGTLTSFAYQKSLWKDRLRISPYILTGSFWPFGITDTRDQYYKITSLGCKGYLDAIKYESISIFIAAGGFVNYSRGLLGTGGWPEEGNNHSEYLFKLYVGGYFGAGIRINPPESSIAYEFSPVNFCFGNNTFMLSYFRFGIDIKLRKKRV